MTHSVLDFAALEAASLSARCCMLLHCSTRRPRREVPPARDAPQACADVRMGCRRAADQQTLAPSLDFLSPKDYHYLLWGLADVTDNGDALLSFDQVRSRCHHDPASGHFPLLETPLNIMGDTNA